MIGQRFGRLLVSECAPAVRSSGRTRPRVICICDCGSRVVADPYSLRNGRSRSCGCLRREVASFAGKSRMTHGEGWRATPEFNAWSAIIQRCTNPRSHAWKNYGGRGITICSEWATDFSAFLKHVGRRPGPEFSIDRIDNDGNYEPGNVRWATAAEQVRNRRPKSRWTALADIKSRAAEQVTA